MEILLTSVGIKCKQKKKGISFGGGAITLDKIIKNDNTKCRQKHREMGALLWEI